MSYLSVMEIFVHGAITNLVDAGMIVPFITVQRIIKYKVFIVVKNVALKADHSLNNYRSINKWEK